MNLLVLSDAPVYKRNGIYYSQDTFLKFMDYLSRHFKKIIYCVPVVNKTLEMRDLCRLFDESSGNLTVVKTFPYKSVIDYYKKILWILVKNFFIFKKAIKASDVVLLRLPAMNSFTVFVLAKIYKKPVISYIVGNEKEVVYTGSKYKGIMKLAAAIAANIHSLVYKNLIIPKSKVSFFLSQNLKRKYTKAKNSYFTFTNLITDKEIIFRNDTFRNDIINILFVGRFTHEKGVEYLLKSIPLLVKEGIPAKLLLCGDGPEKNKLKDIVNHLKLNNLIEFTGFVPWGEKLSGLYLKSNIFILPSLSEGIPKVLLEAMAKGLPIIATNVGGIPDIIKHMENGILIPPKSPKAIADAIKLVISDANLRKRIIKNGYKFVKEHTVEKQAQKIAEVIYKYCR